MYPYYNFILREFAAIQASHHKGDCTVGNERAMEILRRLKKTKEASYPPGETDQYEDQSKDILNLILKGDLSDT